MGEAIDWVTHGPAPHAGFLRANGMIHEAYPPQVRDRAPMAPELPYVKAFRLRGVTPALDGQFEAQFDRALAGAVRYSVADLFRFLFNAPEPDETRTFCSRYVMHTIMQVCPPELWPLVRCMEGDWVSPRDLFISPLLVPAEPVTVGPQCGVRNAECKAISDFGMRIAESKTIAEGATRRAEAETTAGGGVRI